MRLIALRSVSCPVFTLQKFPLKENKIFIFGFVRWIRNAEAYVVFQNK